MNIRCCSNQLFLVIYRYHNLYFLCSVSFSVWLFFWWIFPLHICYIASGSDWFWCNNVYQLYDKDRLAHILLLSFYLYIVIFHQDSLLWTIHAKVAFAKSNWSGYVSNCSAVMFFSNVLLGLTMSFRKMSTWPLHIPILVQIQ